MIQESDICYTTSMYVTQSWCIPDEIDLCYFRICIITHNNNLFNKTSMYSRSKFCPQKTPIGIFENMMSFTPILKEELEQGKLMVALNSRK